MENGNDKSKPTTYFTEFFFYLLKKLKPKKRVNVPRTKRKPLSLLKSKKSFQFSILDREAQINQAQRTNFDLIIIGGGVTGAGIALDATSRGLNVCLIEKNDFASGTSNKSTKLIHGGLRYLKQLEVGLVRESGSERAIVHTLAPHLIIPEKMLLPLFEGGTYGKLMTAIGLKVYDILANVDGDDRRRMLSPEETIAKEPLLKSENILGGGLYAEYRTDDARLTIELLKTAASLGATIINYCEMKSFLYDESGKIKKLECYDYNREKKFNLKAEQYVSATGPWVDLVREQDQSLNQKHLHLTKGVHIVFSRSRFPIKQAIYFDVPDGRMIFAIPRGKVTYVGTTDTNYKGSLNRVVATHQDATYLLDAINHMFPEVQLTIEDIESNWAGLRPLIHEDGKNPSELSRRDEIFVSSSGLVSIAGGKLTGYRKMAHRVMDHLLKELPYKKTKKLKDSYTDEIQLTSDPLTDYQAVRLYQTQLKKRLHDIGIIDENISWYLTTTYGKQSDVIINRTHQYSDAKPDVLLIKAEVWYSIYFEMCNGLADFFVRRTGRLYFDIASVIKYRTIVKNELTKALGWDQNRIDKENAHLDMLLKDASTFYKTEYH